MTWRSVWPLVSMLGAGAGRDVVGGGGHRHYGCVYVMNSICNWDDETKPPTTARPTASSWLVQIGFLGERRWRERTHFS